MRTNSLIVIIILGFVVLWLTISVTEYNGTVSGLDGSTRMGVGNIAGPTPWATALINAQATAAGSPCRVPYDWIPTPNSPQPPCGPGGAPLDPDQPRRSRRSSVQEKMSN